MVVSNTSIYVILLVMLPITQCKILSMSLLPNVYGDTVLARETVTDWVFCRVLVTKLKGLAPGAAPFVHVVTIGPTLVDSGPALDKVVLSEDSYDYDKSGIYMDNVEIIVAGLIGIRLSHPLTATFKVNGVYRRAQCVQRTYTDARGTYLSAFTEEIVGADKCDF